MPTLTAHRFTLQPYAGPKSRATCPACGKPRCFTRYLDTEMGELLPDEFGRCDHEVSCGYARNPYHRDAGGLSYATATERGEARPSGPAPVRRALLPAPTPAAVVSIPPAVFTASLGHYERNNFARLLRTHFGLGVADELLTRYQVGTSNHRSGDCVFWFIDEQDRVRGGKIILYDETFHRVKTADGHIEWAHTALADRYRRQGRPAPAWFAAYEAKDNPKSPCLFGLPQLATAPTGQPVAVVESEKTAVLCTPYLPAYLWLATGSKGQLTADRLEPLRGRRIVLFPDAGALDQWQTRATELRRLGFDVQISDELEKLATAEERGVGLDLADVLLREWPGYPPNWDK